MLVNAAKEICASMDIEHDSLPLRSRGLLARLLILSHLDPFSLQWRIVSPPLPPRVPANCLYALGPKLRLQMGSGFCQQVLGYLHLLHMYPYWYWDPLRRECLQFIDGVEGRKV